MAQENGDDEENSEGISMSLSGGMDSEIYGDSRNRFRGYDTSIAAGDEAENEVSIITMHFIRFINDFFFFNFRMMNMKHQMELFHPNLLVLLKNS